jgi:hypothetical protein
VRLGPQLGPPLEELLDPPPLPLSDTMTPPELLLDPLLTAPELLPPDPLLLLPAGAMHVARAHDSPLAQAVPHPPQFCGSESVDVHTFAQTTRPVSHVPSLLGGSPWPPYAALVLPVPSPTGTSPTQAAKPPDRTRKKESAPGTAMRGACRSIGCPPRAR